MKNEIKFIMKQSLKVLVASAGVLSMLVIVTNIVIFKYIDVNPITNEVPFIKKVIHEGNENSRDAWLQG